MIKNILPIKLIALRKSNNLTQAKLAENLCISRATYAYFESGKRLPDLETLNKIAKYYNVSLDSLVNDKHDFFSESNSEKFEQYKKLINIIEVNNLSIDDIDFLKKFKNLSKDKQDLILKNIDLLK